MEPLWGKYYTTGVTLLDHTKHVVEAAEALYGTADKETRLGRCWLRFFKLIPSEGELLPEVWRSFHTNLLAAALLHDWGKANDGMERVLTGKGDQAIRHEHFSALLIGVPVVSEWLKTAGVDVPLVLSAVLTHHLQAGARADGWACVAATQVVKLLDRHGQFAELVRHTGERLGAGALDVTRIPEVWKVGGKEGDIRASRTTIQERVLAPIKRKTLDERRMLLAVRAGLIAADAAGSGYTRVGQPVGATVWREFVEREPWTRELVWADVLDKRVAAINEQLAKRGKGETFRWDEFQDACELLSDRALLLAPCGSGKTLAAWRWIAAQAGRRPVGRVLFLYPTRATAKEGFRDYVSWAPEAALMHANAAFDLSGMFADGSDSRSGNDYEADRRLYSLGYWPRRAFSATVDQFLGFMQHGYGPLCMLPVLADSVVVIDEVHSFDRHMFTALKGFLKSFAVPVLCMTATLPPGRREDLKSCGLQEYTEKEGVLKTIADAPRYTLAHGGTRAEAFEEVRTALKAGRRVLWVTNTVRRCHEVTAQFAHRYDQLRTADGKPVFCYHSRFKLSDRVKRHDEIVNALKVGQPAALGVTTQVCEMSLDLDVDVLVTEECPVTSLIQRMGRCNRQRIARPPKESGRVIVYKPDSETPYTPDDLKGLREFLNEVSGCTLSQLVLEATMNGLKELPPWLGDNPVTFLESGPYAVRPKADEEDASTFREGSDFNRPCVLPGTDLERFVAAGPREQPGFAVPVPKKLAKMRDDRLPHHLWVAAGDRYHEAVGYCDRPLSEWGAE